MVIKNDPTKSGEARVATNVVTKTEYKGNLLLMVGSKRLSKDVDRFLIEENMTGKRIVSQSGVEKRQKTDHNPPKSTIGSLVAFYSSDED